MGLYDCNDGMDVMFSIGKYWNKKEEIRVKGVDVYGEYLKYVDNRKRKIDPLNKRDFYSICRLLGASTKKSNGTFWIIFPADGMAINDDDYSVNIVSCIDGHIIKHDKNNPSVDYLLHLLSHIKHCRDYVPISYDGNECKRLVIHRGKLIDEILENSNISDADNYTNNLFEKFDDENKPQKIGMIMEEEKREEQWM